MKSTNDSPDVRASGADSSAPSVFAEPWEAQAFALAVHLSAEGHFTWKEWTETLAAELATDDGTRYYEHWLAALEKIVKAKGLLDVKE